MSKAKTSKEYSPDDIKSEILFHAKSLRTPVGWAETIADKTAQHVDDWVSGRGSVTDEDLRRIAYEKLKELNPDIAYIYKTYGKII